MGRRYFDVMVLRTRLLATAHLRSARLAPAVRRRTGISSAAEQVARP